jgi:ArsR family transcriptional regulator
MHHRIDDCQCMWEDGVMPTVSAATAVVAHGRPLIADLAACCAPITGAELDAAAAQRLAAVLKALADPTRLRLLSLVAAHRDSEECICNLTERVGVSQPTVSHHMKVLVDVGLVEREQRGKWAYYRVVPGALDLLAGMLARASGERR